MNLGKALVKELNLDPGVDTLGRWMAHYIAEQIEVAENTTGVDKKEAEERCFETILKFWKHRSYFPRGGRPLENFEPILRALARLDPENKHNYFFEDRPRRSENIPEEVQKWLDVANGIDEAARVWLEYVFKQAALSASDENTAEWLKNTAFIQDSEDVSIIVRGLIRDFELEESIEDFQQINKDNIISSIEKLEAFNQLNQVLLLEYKQKLVDYS